MPAAPPVPPAVLAQTPCLHVPYFQPCNINLTIRRIRHEVHSRGVLAGEVTHGLPLIALVAYDVVLRAWNRQQGPVRVPRDSGAGRRLVVHLCDATLPVSASRAYGSDTDIIIAGFRCLLVGAMLLYDCMRTWVQLTPARFGCHPFHDTVV